MKIRIFIIFFIHYSVLIVHCSLAQMTWNQACLFEGDSTSYVSVPHSSSLNITGDFTIEAWVNPNNIASPSAQIILQKRAVGNNSGYTLYLSSGKIALRTNSSTRLVGKTAISNNQWTHIAGSYKSSSGVFRVFINGAQDTTSTVAGAAPTSNTDSLLIGVGNNAPFFGLLDEVRIWNRAFTVSDVPQFMRLSLGTNSGYYSGLVMSLTFQGANPAVALFSLADWSGNNNNGFNRGVTAKDFSNKPSTTISINECLVLDGTGDYLAGPDNSNISPTSGITVEAWVYPLSFNANSNIFSTIVHKGSSNGTVTDYRMSVNLRKFDFQVNETSIFSLATSGEFFPLNKWTHVAFSYSGANGFTQLILNGEIRWDDTNFVGNIHDNNDSLYIGGTQMLQCFNGLLDEVRINKSVLPYGTISNQVYTSVNESNDPSSVNVAYNFDGQLISNSDTGPRLYFRNDARFTQNAYFNNVPVSPMTYAGTTNFPKGFYLNNPNFRIPSTGTSGFMTSDTIDVPISETINDVNVFVALNHTDEDNLVLSLISPSGNSVTLYSTSSLLNPSDNIITLFNDQAGAAMLSNTYVMYTPVINPLNNINSVLTGSNTLGKWKLRIQDVAPSDTGILYGWGIQFNNQLIRKSVLSLTSLIEGLYNPATNLMIPDTMRVYIRNNNSPYAILDSSKALLNDSGKANFVFNNVTDGLPVYIQLKHRNSLETWSRKPSSGTFALLFSILFTPFTSHLKYDFTPSAGSAFGNNMKLVDTGPNEFAIYSGDVNQDGSIDLADGSTIDNDAYNFISGYAVTDLNGDGIVDLADYTIADNNAYNFVSKVTP
ncbi:MAG: LamG-like jellyroll fold domain-containing protein [bacterium]